MIQFKTNLILIVAIILVKNVYSLCENKDALNNVTLSVHHVRGSRSIKYEDISMYHFDKHEVINVFHGNITDLCEGMVKSFPKLKVLNLINVNLSKIEPNAFEIVQKLEELSLAVNQLTELVDGSFNNLYSLETLYLSGNNINTIQAGAFQHLKKLKRLHLDNNELSKLDNSVFSENPLLRLVDLRFNNFATIDGSTFPQIQPSYSGAIEILLAKNHITDVDPKAFTFQNPINLHLERNKLNTISNLFHGIADYSSLFLDFNEFNCLPDDVVENLQNTPKTIHLANNPITCSCLQTFQMTFKQDEPVEGVIGKLVYCSDCPCDSPATLLDGDHS